MSIQSEGEPILSSLNDIYTIILKYEGIVKDCGKTACNEYEIIIYMKDLMSNLMSTEYHYEYHYMVSQDEVRWHYMVSRRSVVAL